MVGRPVPATARVLYVAPWVVEGGADRAIVDWFQYLDGRRYEKYLVTTLRSTNPWIDRVRHFAREVWDLPSMSFSDAEIEAFILDFVARKRVALVQVMNSPHGFRLLPRLKAFPNPPAVVAQFHTFDLTRDNQRAGWVVDAPQRWDKQIDTYVVSTDYLQQYLTLELKIALRRVRLIYNGISTQDYCRESITPDPRILQYRKPQKLNILFVGRLDRQKDPVLAAHVLHCLKRMGVPAFLHVIGDALLDSERAELERFIRDKSLQADCALYGAQSNLRPWYLLADVALLTSRWEGVPYFVCEAMALEIPFVAPAIGGIPEILTSETGVLVKNRDDAKDYANGLAQLASDPDRRRTLGRAARLRIEQHFRVEQMAELHDRLYQEIVETAESEVVPNGPVLPSAPAVLELRGDAPGHPSEGAEAYLSPEDYQDILRDVDTGERFAPLRTRKGITSAEHFARYLLAANLCKGKRVLDIACGVGYGSYLLRRAGADSVVGVDYNAKAISLAAHAYRHAGLAFVQADAYTFADPEGFDLIVCFETIEHLDDPDSFLRQLTHNLRSGGQVLLSCPNDAVSVWKSPFHVRDYSYEELVLLLQNHFPHVRTLGQVNAIASVIGDATLASDNLKKAGAGEWYWDVARPKGGGDTFITLCGCDPLPVLPEPIVVSSKNLTDLLRELREAADFHRNQAEAWNSQFLALEVRYKQLQAEMCKLEEKGGSRQTQSDDVEVKRLQEELSTIRARLVEQESEVSRLAAEKESLGHNRILSEQKVTDLFSALEQAAAEQQRLVAEYDRLYSALPARIARWLRRLVWAFPLRVAAKRLSKMRSERKR